MGSLPGGSQLQDIAPDGTRVIFSRDGGSCQLRSVPTGRTYSLGSTRRCEARFSRPNAGTVLVREGSQVTKRTLSGRQVRRVYTTGGGVSPHIENVVQTPHGTALAVRTGTGWSWSGSRTAR